MEKLIVKNFRSCDETRPFEAHGRAEFIQTAGGVVARGVFEPGWRWSADVKPLAGTRSCEVAHACYVLSGRMHLLMDDGQEADIGPGDCAVIPPGHDAWTVGDEACVILDFGGAMQDYARATAGSRREGERTQPGTH